MTHSEKKEIGVHSQEVGWEERWDEFCRTNEIYPREESLILAFIAQTRKEAVEDERERIARELLDVWTSHEPEKNMSKYINSITPNQ